jgi:hypothetical protein
MYKTSLKAPHGFADPRDPRDPRSWASAHHRDGDPIHRHQVHLELAKHQGNQRFWEISIGQYVLYNVYVYIYKYIYIDTHYIYNYIYVHYVQTCFN